LREYIDLRLVAFDPSKREASISRSKEIQSELWKGATIVADGNQSPIIALFLTSLREVIDLHTKRIEAELGFRVPPEILLVLFVVAVLTMVLLVVYNSYRERRSLVALIILVLMLSAVLILIVDLDRSHQGFVRISQQALIDLKQSLSSIP
jgi:hypothetical protein